VGKSSLLNAVQSGLGLAVREISEYHQRGRHTTQVRELFPLDAGGYVADMPGIKALALWDTQPEELDGYFPELRDLVAQCQFSNCSHRTEPGCAVRAAVDTGQVHPERYISYLRLRYGDSADVGQAFSLPSLPGQAESLPYMSKRRSKYGHKNDLERYGAGSSADTGSALDGLCPAANDNG
jgi:hypothetical protein